ncbi:MAG: hypothetical protein PHE25_01490 [Candidatus Gracilibacteria bacterium]|nr:hypothetical protein [Candidatus Gracilibacteria bacterium]
MDLSILDVLYLVLILFTTVIGSLLSVVLYKLLGILNALTEIIEIYNNIKRIFLLYSHLPEIFIGYIKNFIFGKK